MAITIKPMRFTLTPTVSAFLDANNMWWVLDTIWAYNISWRVPNFDGIQMWKFTPVGMANEIEKRIKVELTIEYEFDKYYKRTAYLNAVDFPDECNDYWACRDGSFVVWVDRRYSSPVVFFPAEY